MSPPIGLNDPERPLTLLNFPFHSMIFVMQIIVLYAKMLITTCKCNDNVSKICLSIIPKLLFVLTGKICSKNRKRHQLFFEILAHLRPKLKHIATVKNVTYHTFRCFMVLILVFQKIGKKFQKTWNFSFIGKYVRKANFLTATRKCSSFSRAPQSHKYACAELKKELLPVCTKICFFQVIFANLRDIRAHTKRTNMPKEGKN